jgi:serine/threonine-protein kinase HipA
MRERRTIVYIYLDGGPVPAGRLDIVEDGRNSFAEFRYGARYVQRPDAVALDPIELPLPTGANADQVYRTREGFEVFNGIQDAAPDGWGRFLVSKAAGAIPLTEFDYLVASGDNRVGALAFGPDATSGPKRIWPWAQQELMDGDTVDLAQLQKAVDDIAAGIEMDANARRLLDRGSPLGGARPKATTTHEGRPWIAKFETASDPYPVSRAEWAAMRIATECALDVPNIALKEIGKRAVFLIERFDRQEVDGIETRRHFASGLTMLAAPEIATHHYSYRDLAEAVRRHGSAPARDLHELFRRMTFNALVGNDDDHLRNHGFLYDGKGWRLSPLYDVAPKPQSGSDRSLVLNVGDYGKEASLRNARSGAKNFGLSDNEAVSVLEELRALVAARWEPVCKECGISGPELARMATCFQVATNANWQDE